jgi:predicted nuclease of predicted toxin-antitoxin system
VRLRDAAWLLDENINSAVLDFLEAAGSSVLDVRRDGLIGAADDALLDLGRRDERVIITHDRDFGRLAFARTDEFYGVVFLRPGHHSPDVVLQLMDAAISLDMDLAPPFVVVVQWREDGTRIRIRQFG